MLGLIIGIIVVILVIAAVYVSKRKHTDNSSLAGNVSNTVAPPPKNYLRWSANPIRPFPVTTFDQSVPKYICKARHFPSTDFHIGYSDGSPICYYGIDGQGYQSSSDFSFLDTDAYLGWTWFTPKNPIYLDNDPTKQAPCFVTFRNKDFIIGETSPDRTKCYHNLGSSNNPNVAVADLDRAVQFIP